MIPIYRKTREHPVSLRPIPDSASVCIVAVDSSGEMGDDGFAMTIGADLLGQRGIRPENGFNPCSADELVLPQNDACQVITDYSEEMQ